MKFNKHLFSFVLSATLLFDILVSAIVRSPIGFGALIMLAVLFLLLGFSLGVGESEWKKIK